LFEIPNETIQVIFSFLGADANVFPLLTVTAKQVAALE
jgi:hypothetical protein